MAVPKQNFTNAGMVEPFSSLYFDYPQTKDVLLKDAMNKSRQISAGSAAGRGQTSSRGAAQNMYSRLMSDYNISDAQTDFGNRLQYTNTMNNVMRSPGAVKPSGLQSLSSMGGAIGGAILKEASPDIWKRLKPDMWNSTPQQLSQQYQALSAPVANDIAGAYQPDYGGMYSGLSNSAYADLSGGFSPDYLSGADYASPATDAATSLWDYDTPFNFDFGNVWGL